MPRKKAQPIPETKAQDQDYERWCARVARAKKVRSAWEKRYEVETLEQMFYGDMGSHDKDALSLNHTCATIKTLKPNIFLATPKYYVRPKAGRKLPVEQARAALAEGVLDTVANQDQNLKQAATLAIYQAFWRIGVLKTVYDPREVDNPDKGQPIWATDAAGNPLTDKTTGEKVQLVDPKTQKRLVEPDTITTDDCYRFEWVDAQRILLPDEGPDRNKWTWIGEEVVVPLDVAKNDSRFKGKSLEANAAQQDTPNARGGRRSRKLEDLGEDSEELFAYTEVYDIAKKKLLIWAEGQSEDGFLVNGPLPDGIEDHPYALLLGFTPILGTKSCPWPFPFTHPWKDPQREYNTRRTQIMEGAKRSARKVAFFEGTFQDEEEARKALKSSADMEAVKVSDPKLVPVPIEERGVNPTILQDIPLLQGDWRIITGQSGPRLASTDSSTATEASFVERAANLRDADMVDAVNDWLTLAGKKMLKLVRATLTFGMLVKLRGITDEQVQKYVQQVYQIPAEMLSMFPGIEQMIRERYGKERWQRVRREDLDFDADVSVVPGSSRPRNLDVERSQWFQFLQLLGQYPQLALNRELLRYTFKMFDALDDRLLDELTATSQQSIQIAANQAGRNQGGNQNGGGANPMQGNPIQAALMGATMGGGM